MLTGMEVHRQRCQNCGSLDQRNLILRAEGRPITVFVRCTQCGSLVARYQLSDYYHHGKSYESWLRGRFLGRAEESGRDLRHSFEETQEEAVAELEEVLAELERLGKTP